MELNKHCPAPASPSQPDAQDALEPELQQTPLDAAPPEAATPDSFAQHAPACAPAVVYPPSPQKDMRPVRRVGAVTSGLTLIAGGLLLCATLLVPRLNLLWVFRLAPLLLVLLGIEILVSQMFAKSMRIKYDFISVILTIVVLGCALTAAALPMVFTYYGPERTALQQSLSAEWESALYGRLHGNADIDAVHANISLRDMASAEQISALADLDARDYTELSVVLSGNYADKAAFLTACTPVLEAIRTEGTAMPQVVSIRTRQSGEAIAYTLNLSSPYQMDKAPQALADRVEESVYDAEEGQNDYVSRETLAERETARAAAEQAAQDAASQVDAGSAAQ